MTDKIQNHAEVDGDTITATPPNEKMSETPLQHVEDPEKLAHSTDGEDMTTAKKVYSRSGRQLSEWEAIQIAAAGDIETINAEIDELEVELQNRPRSRRWYNYELSFKDPRHFTYVSENTTARLSRS